MLPFSINISSNFIMSSNRKIFRRKHSTEIITIILILKNCEKSHDEIVRYLNIAWSSIIIIIHRNQRQSKSTFRINKRTNRSLKLTTRDSKCLLRHVKINSHDSFAALTTLSKSEKRLHRNIVRKYLTVKNYFRFRICSKLYLTAKYKIVHYRWILEYKNWTLKNWKHVIWTDEATFETNLNTRFCYVSRKKNKVMKNKYLKFTFKSGRSSASIWKTIFWEIKNPVHFLAKEDRMNSNIYIHQMLKKLKLLFYCRCMKDRDFMIYMNDEADYHTSKTIILWKRKNDLNRTDWSIQFLDLNSIENL